MPAKAPRRATLATSLSELVATRRGQEAAMYVFLRDIFCDVLGYSRTSVVADVGGERGRPDVTVYAQGGNNAGRVSWIVLEAKDEHGAVGDPKRRNAHGGAGRPLPRQVIFLLSRLLAPLASACRDDPTEERKVFKPSHLAFQARPAS